MEQYMGMRNSAPTFDVIVVGGGHAGIEASSASCRLGARVLLLTHRRDRIGALSCNPAIGGVGKGHLVREIDALDGLMGRAADLAGIQFRVLNRSRGPAVWGLRAQVDRDLYGSAVRELLFSCIGLRILEDAAERLLLDGGEVCGVLGATGREYRAGSVVLTTGTFLRGMIHRGGVRESAGRIGEEPSLGLAEQLLSPDFAEGRLRLGRLKTGTPPRLLRSSIDWDSLEQQQGEDEPLPFSLLTEGIAIAQRSCAITWTNCRTHGIVRDHLGESAVYSGEVSGRGPRYCPSLEDKVVRFPDRASHQVFLEPEGIAGISADRVYPNGVSTSLGEAAQREFIRSMGGLERAEIVQYGYAIEYDYVDPRCLGLDLQVCMVPGLYLAGQINGTTGYEEAAAQGLLAGLNAALRSGGGGEFTLDRSQGYMGVLVDDLVVRGVTEPYRMFTSRAEFRLLLRSDNADLRLTPLGEDLGCIGLQRRESFAVWRREVEGARALLGGLDLTPEQALRRGLRVNADGRRRSGLQLLSLEGVDFGDLENIWPELGVLSGRVREQMRIEALYEGYLSRQRLDIRRFRRDESVCLSTDLDYGVVPGLSAEVRERLEAVRPASVGQAARLEGVTPGALAVLLSYVRRRSAGAAGATG